MARPKKDTQLRHETIVGDSGQILNKTQIRNTLQLSEEEFDPIDQTAREMLKESRVESLRSEADHIALQPFVKKLIDQFPREFSLASQNQDDPELLARIVKKIFQRQLSNSKRRKHDSLGEGKAADLPVRSRESSVTIIDPLLMGPPMLRSSQPSSSQRTPMFGVSPPSRATQFSTMQPPYFPSMPEVLDFQIHSCWKPDGRLSMISVEDILQSPPPFIRASSSDGRTVSYKQFLSLVCEDLNLAEDQIDRIENITQGSAGQNITGDRNLRTAISHAQAEGYKRVEFRIHEAVRTSGGIIGWLSSWYGRGSKVVAPPVSASQSSALSNYRSQHLAPLAYPSQYSAPSAYPSQYSAPSAYPSQYSTQSPDPSQNSASTAEHWQPPTHPPANPSQCSAPPAADLRPTAPLSGSSVSRVKTEEVEHKDSVTSDSDDVFLGRPRRRKRTSREDTPGSGSGKLRYTFRQCPLNTYRCHYYTLEQAKPLKRQRPDSPSSIVDLTMRTPSASPARKQYSASVQLSGSTVHPDDPPDDTTDGGEDHDREVAKAVDPYDIEGGIRLESEAEGIKEDQEGTKIGVKEREKRADEDMGEDEMDNEGFDEGQDEGEDEQDREVKHSRYVTAHRKLHHWLTTLADLYVTSEL